MRKPGKIAIIGLGYVGLPLAVEFGKQYPTLGFDVKAARVAALQVGNDETGEVAPEELAAARALEFTTDAARLAEADVYIVAVPTPIDRHRQPDLSPLIGASELVGAAISPGDVVIYESRGYPGATEEDCLPVVERVSGLVFNRDFFAGYSPERINPGDKARPITRIVKVTSGSTPEIAEFVDALYRSIIPAGTLGTGEVPVTMTVDASGAEIRYTLVGAALAALAFLATEYSAGWVPLPDSLRGLIVGGLVLSPYGLWAVLRVFREFRFTRG